MDATDYQLCYGQTDQDFVTDAVVTRGPTVWYVRTGGAVGTGVLEWQLVGDSPVDDPFIPEHSIAAPANDLAKGLEIPERCRVRFAWTGNTGGDPITVRGTDHL